MVSLHNEALAAQLGHFDATGGFQTRTGETVSLG